MKKITHLIAVVVLTLCFNPVCGQTVFDWETSIDNGPDVTETVDGITVTVTSPGTSGISQDADYGNAMYGGVEGLAIARANITTDPVIFTFSEPVDVHTILVVEAAFSNMNWTFSTTDGTNADKVISFTNSDGIASESPVSLNWTGVTSFSVTASEGSYMLFDKLSVSPTIAPTIFDWETSIDNGPDVTETLDGITVTVTSPGTSGISQDADYGNAMYGGVEELSIHRPNVTTDPVIFTFSEPVDVHTILVIEAAFSNMNWTFSTTDGTNADKVISFTNSDGIASESPVSLNWTGVTSFSVTPSADSYMLFDKLSVSPSTSLSIEDNYISQYVKVYPNPVKNILTIKNVSGLKSITVYNNLGQMVLQSKKKQLDVSHLSKGMYVLQIHSGQGIETKRIIKQ